MQKSTVGDWWVWEEEGLIKHFKPNLARSLGLPAPEMHPKQ